MMKKILTFSVVLAMALVMLTAPAAGFGEDLQGMEQDSPTGVSLTSGNISVVHVQDAGDICVYDGVNIQDQSGYASYTWDATKPVPIGWTDAPTTVGDDLYFIKEAGGCVGATQVPVTSDALIPPSQSDNTGRLEEIPVPTQNAVGSDYINITIPAFKYTGYGATSGGTFDAATSYAVFMSDDGGTTWTYINNADNFVAGPDTPIEPMSGTDPTTIDTGHYTFNTSTDGGLTLNPDTDYEFKVRVNIGPTGALGGYGGGLGSYTTYSAGASSGAIHTDPLSEFGVGLIVPVVATIGLFATFTVYRKRKKDE